MTICPKCRLWNPDAADRCSGCGHAFPSPVTQGPPVVPRTVRLDPALVRLGYWALGILSVLTVVSCIVLVWVLATVDVQTDKAIQDYDRQQQVERQADIQRQEQK